jgi:signal transduction histidine kinase
VPADQLQPALARALGDPGLQLVFPVAGGYVDAQGGAVPAPSAGRGVTPIGDAAAPAAVLIHDPVLADEAGLVQAAGAAARLALDNARLQAEVKAQLAEVRASRARLVNAGDAARRRLERDLHDGAQQRLLTAGLALQMLRQQLPGLGADDQGLLAEAEAELRGALDELRELARGLHPAILTNQGLRAAVDQLALRCSLPVTVTGDPGRLPAQIESTAYFVVNEALANIAKHAAAGRATVALDHPDGRVVVTVADDGVGGADPAAGTGLAGLADRVAAVDGTFTVTSRPGAGTRTVADLPDH